MNHQHNFYHSMVRQLYHHHLYHQHHQHHSHHLVSEGDGGFLQDRSQFHLVRGKSAHQRVNHCHHRSSSSPLRLSSIVIVTIRIIIDCHQSSSSPSLLSLNIIITIMRIFDHHHHYHHHEHLRSSSSPSQLLSSPLWWSKMSLISSLQNKKCMYGLAKWEKRLKNTKHTLQVCYCKIENLNNTKYKPHNASMILLRVIWQLC